jgi:hypothetical protein
MTQTVDIPDNRVISLKVPNEIPVGQTNIVIQFPVKNEEKRHIDEQFDVETLDVLPNKRMTAEEEMEWFNRNAEWLNKEAEENLSFQAALW